MNTNDNHMVYDERLSKNYKVSLERYQEEHFRPVVFVYDDDVIDTFSTFFCHLLESSTKMFYQVIDNPHTAFWYSSLNVSMKALTRMLKDMHIEAGLDDEYVTNKSGPMTCVTRMVVVGIPTQVGMQIIVHKSKGLYM